VRVACDRDLTVHVVGDVVGVDPLFTVNWRSCVLGLF